MTYKKTIRSSAIKQQEVSRTGNRGQIVCYWPNANYYAEKAMARGFEVCNSCDNSITLVNTSKSYV